MDLLLILSISFLLGSFPTAYILVKKTFQKDIRKIGSGNPGMMNVLDNFGKRYAYFGGTVDILKGIIAVSIAKLYSPNETVAVLAGLTAIAGHDFTPFLKFKGGNGVATLIGVLFATHWLFGAIYVAIWLLTAAIFRYSSLAALIATFSIPVYAYFLEQNLQYAISFSIITAILFWRHKSNIYKLFCGKENKIGQHEHK